MRVREALVIGVIVVGVTIVVTTVRQPIQRIGDMVVIEVPAATAAPVELEQRRALEDDVEVCRERTEHLRLTLEALIRVWPGRAKLPEPPEGWPAWPEPGVARKWRRDGW